MMKRVLVLLVLVCLIVSCNVFGNTAFEANGSSVFKTLVVPKNGQTDLHSNEPLIQFQFQAVTDNITINDIGVSVNNSALISTASVSIKNQNNNDTLNVFLNSLSDNTIDDIMNKESSSTFTVASGDIVTVIINAKVSASAVPSNRLELKVHSIGSIFGSSSFDSYVVDKTATVNVSGFQDVTVNSVVSDSKILAGHENFPVLQVEVGPMVGEGLDSELSVVVEKNSDDIINRVRLCEDIDKDKSIDNISDCGDYVSFLENRATPNLSSILNSEGNTTNVLVVYDLSTSTPNSLSDSYKAKVSTVLGTGTGSNQPISETAFNGNDNGNDLDLVGVIVNATADTPTGNVIPGNVTNDMLIIEVNPIGVSVNVAKLQIGNGNGVQFQDGQSDHVKSIHVFDGTALRSADAFTSSEATVTLNKRILSGDDTNFTIQYVLPTFDNEQAIVQAVVKEASEFQVTVNGTAYIANSESGTENFKVFNLPIESEERSVSDVKDKVVLRSVTPNTNDLVFVGQQSVPIFELDILNNKQESVVAELTVKATDPNGSSGFNVNNQGIVGINVLNDTGDSVGFLSVSDSGESQTIQFSVSKSPNVERYTIGVNVGQDPDAVKTYNLSLGSSLSGIDVVKSEDIRKETSFSVANHNLEVSFDSFVDTVATVTVTNNTGASVTVNRVSLSAFQDGLGGNVVALNVIPSENIVIENSSTKTIRLPVTGVLNAETMDVVFLPIIQATVSGNAVLLSRYRTNDTFTSPFLTNTQGIRQSFSANTSVDPSMVHVKIESINKESSTREFSNGDAVTPNSQFVIQMRNPGLWESVQLESVSAPHTGSDTSYNAETGQLHTRVFTGSGSFSLRVTPTEGSPFSIPIQFLMSRSLAVSDPLFYPNPYNTAGASPLQMAINTTTPSDVVFTLYDMRGRVVVSHNQSVPLGYTNVAIPSSGQLASGMYIAYVVIQSNGESVKKVVRLAVY